MGRIDKEGRPMLCRCKKIIILQSKANQVNSVRARVHTIAVEQQ